MADSEGCFSGDSRDNDSGDVAPTPVDCGDKQIVDDSEVADDSEVPEMHVEMEETINAKKGTGVANLLLSKGFVLEHQDGVYALFGPHSCHPLVEYSREEDFYNRFNNLDVNDVVVIYPEYKNVLLGVVGCARGVLEESMGIEGSGSRGVLEEPMGIEGSGSRGVLEELKGTVSQELKGTGTGGVLEEFKGTESQGVLEEFKGTGSRGVEATGIEGTVTETETVLSELFEEGARLLIPKGKGKGKGKKNVVFNSLEQLLAWRSENAREKTLSNKVRGKGKRKRTVSEEEMEGEISDIPVHITPQIRCSRAVVEMVSDWLVEMEQLTRNIEKSKQLVLQSQSIINKCLDSMRHQRDSMNKNVKSLAHFKHIVTEALLPFNVAKGIIVSSLSQYNIVKNCLKPNVTIYCQHNLRRKGEIRNAVRADNRTFSTYLD